MTKTTWRGRLIDLARNVGARRAGSVSDRSTRRRSSRRPQLERLEDRIAPATNITIIVGAAGTGNLDSFLSATQGTITTADDPGDPAATLSTGALLGVNSTTNIGIAADNAITFDDLGGTLTLHTCTGHSAAFSTSTGPISFANVTNTLATSGAALSFTAGTSLTAASLVSNGADITLIADSMSLTQPINAGTAIATLAPFTVGRGIDVGLGTTAGDLDLSNAALAEITAGTLRVGSVGAGALAVTAALDNPGGANTLDLRSDGVISQTTGSTITASNLVVTAGTGVTLNNNNVVTTLAGSAGASFQFTNKGNLLIGSVAGVNGVSTANGPINLTVTGGNLTTMITTGPAISAPGNTVTLKTSGAIVSEGAIIGTPPDVTDVAAASLVITNAFGVAPGFGTGVAPFKTAVSTFAASVGSGGVFMTNTSPALDIGTVDGVNGVIATGGNVHIGTSADLTVSQAVSTTGPAFLFGDDAGAGSNINITAPITGNSATVLGGTGADVITVTVTSPTPLLVNGQGGGDTLVFDDLHVSIGSVPGRLSVVTAAGLQSVLYTNIARINLNDAAAIDAFYGPDTADRVTALTGLTADERFVQVLYLAALGRAGSKAEIDGWAAFFSSPNMTQTQDQVFIANGIEGSPEGRDHLVKSWYVHFLGRTAKGGEEQGWVNLLLQGQSEETVLSDILGDGGHEFYNRAQTLISSGTADERFVQALYLVLLNRTGGSSEVSTWVNDLATVGHQGVAFGFLGSPEFRTYEFEGFYNALLHRPADVTGLNGWVAHNFDLFHTRIDFEGSPDFFANG